MSMKFTDEEVVKDGEGFIIEAAGKIFGFDCNEQSITWEERQEIELEEQYNEHEISDY